MWVELKNLGIRPGMSLFLSGTKVTKFKGFKANLACKWKGKYRGVTVKEGWCILTNLKTLKAAISAYKQRYDIEEMFRDYKSGGYNIEDTQVSEPRLLTLTLFCHFRQKIIWKAYSIRLLPKILISAILLENKRSNARYIYS